MCSDLCYFGPDDTPTRTSSGRVGLIPTRIKRALFGGVTSFDLIRFAVGRCTPGQYLQYGDG